ncbi:tetraspanin-32 isoform D [Patagioenas fasciata monilis]|uniref:Tetraspanin n=1 Tax=Patagioenas fasciata monilis TaxID=372326 RepID=A0A1V4JNM3_PATFA|nr:tetraspanin-32 isoform D [Patagioenas fasciata monilis]
MGPRCGMRTTKCQLLATSLCVMLLGLSIATLSTVTHYGLHFTLISNISLESNSYRFIHYAGCFARLELCEPLRGLPPCQTRKYIHMGAFYFGICLSMTLILAALLSSAATVRESQCLTAMGFFCFALAFCGLIPAACWRYMHSTEVEDSMMDVYDFVYEEVRRNSSSFRRHELTAIHEAFLCCGKHSPFGDMTNVEHKTCPSSIAGQDCLQEIRDFLRKHMDFISTLLGVTIGFMVYGMILTSFLWFSIHFSNNLDRKGKYILRER